MDLRSCRIASAMYRQSMIDYGAPLEASEAPTPQPAGSQILLRVSHCGVCHSDIHLHDGYFELGDGKRLDVRGGRALPFTLGHEIAGTVEAAGPDAGDIDPERAYAVYPWMGCGECRRCLAGDEHLCATTHHLGITVDGGYASHVLVPHPRYLIDISGVAPELAGSFMCSGVTAYSAVRKVLPYLNGGPLMIVGLGGVGMMGLSIARVLTDGPIVVADIDAAKRQAALDAGALHVFDPGAEDARKAVFKACGAVAAAIDFAGAESSFNFAQGVVGKAGAVAVVGLIGGKLSMPLPMLPLRQLAILGCFVGSIPEARALVDLARSGKIATIPIATRPLAEADAALADLRAGRILGRVVLTP
jgi:D-arabinose 1-dehydrogenase-like Zn-dependent alcohol dehydrogenase